MSGRKVAVRGKPPPSIFIVCEGTKTEVKYFEGFRLSFVKVIGTGKNTKSIVDEALARIADDQPKQCWCVFDRDSFPPEHVNTAWERARAKGCQVAISNECFELWYLLHFDYIESALSRTAFSEMLTVRLGHPYDKAGDGLYDELLDKQAAAIRNAKKLIANYSPYNPARHNPSTTVHILVEELNRHSKPPVPITTVA